MREWREEILQVGVDRDEPFYYFTNRYFFDEAGSWSVDGVFGLFEIRAVDILVELKLRSGRG